MTYFENNPMFLKPSGKICIGFFMRILSLVLLTCLATLPALAQQRPAARPAAGQQAIGRFDDWSAWQMQENGQRVCYMGVKARASTPRLSGRGDVILTVTHRANARDQVSIMSGYAYPSGAEVQVRVLSSGTELAFYTSARAAFARDGRAAIAALRRGREAVAKGPVPRGSGQVTDTFSLRGFTAAYEAISRACPSR